MKCRVQLTHTVTMIVEGKSEGQIQDWLNETTPEEAYLLAYGSGATTDYHKEIICFVDEDIKTDYVIEEKK